MEPLLLAFFDDFYISRRVNMERHIAEPTYVTAYQDPYLDTSWAYPSIVKDIIPGQWLCLYQGQPKSSDHRHIIAIAESDDGLNWSVPDLSKRIDIPDRVAPHQLLPGYGEWGPCYCDERAEPAERIKGFVSGPQRGEGVRAPLYVSADGFHWRHLPGRSWHPLGIDPSVSAYWNQYTKSYCIAARPNFADRRIALYETCDWREYSSPHMIMQADAQDSPAAEIYGMPVFPYEQMFIGFLWMYHTSQDINSPHKFFFGKVDCQLAYSYDGRYFLRGLREPFISNVQPDDEGAGCVYPSCLVRLPDRLRIYSSSSQGEHAQFRGQPELRQSAILIHELRVDGFCYLAPAAGAGEITTRLFFWQGDTLSVNVMAPRGEVRVEITDVNGVAIPGFALADCMPFTGDSIAWEPVWKGGSLDGLKGKIIRFRVTVVNGRLYGIKGVMMRTDLGEVRKFVSGGIAPAGLYAR